VRNKLSLRDTLSHPLLIPPPSLSGPLYTERQRRMPVPARRPAQRNHGGHPAERIPGLFSARARADSAERSRFWRSIVYHGIRIRSCRFGNSAKGGFVGAIPLSETVQGDLSIVHRLLARLCVIYLRARLRRDAKIKIRENLPRPMPEHVELPGGNPNEGFYLDTDLRDSAVGILLLSRERR